MLRNPSHPRTSRPTPTIQTAAVSVSTRSSISIQLERYRPLLSSHAIPRATQGDAFGSWSQLPFASVFTGCFRGHACAFLLILTRGAFLAFLARLWPTEDEAEGKGQTIITLRLIVT